MSRGSFAAVLVALLMSCMIISCSDEKSTGPEVVPDNVVPSIQIEEPASTGAWVTLDGSCVVSGNASDDVKLESVVYSVDGAATQAAVGLESWTTPSLPLANGDHLVVVTASDGAGNSASDSIAITKNPYLEFIGRPFSNPTGVFAGVYTQVIFRVSIGYDPNLIASSVELVEIDEDNNIIENVTRLYDNGDLGQADEIANDGVFSAFVTMSESTVQTKRLRVVAYSNEGSEPNFSMVFPFSIFEQLEAGDVQDVIDLQTLAGSFLNDSTSGLPLDQATGKLADWLTTQSEVMETKVLNGNIEVKYESGLEGGILITELDANGNVTTKGSRPSAARAAAPSVPVRNQTTGVTAKRAEGSLTSAIDDEYILDKDVLIWAPFEQVFSPDMRPSLEDIFDDSDLDLNVVTMRNQQCTIASLENLTNYGAVIFDTHGSGGRDILTGELVTAQNRTTYALMLRENKLRIWTNIVYDKVLFIFNKTADIYSIRPAFIDALAGTFPNSVIFNGSCESTTSADLSNAFINKGAKTYYGFDDVVNTTFCRDMCDDIFESLTVDLETTGEAFVAGQNDPVSPFATFEMNGSAKMHFTFSLLNGGFEAGDLTAWTKDGDGRVISQLGNLVPPEESFMGIISTGLGFTTSTGSISQAFRVDAAHPTLTVTWNFISEEFEEFVGSQYQDYFIIEVLSEGSTTQLFSKAVDQFWSDYTMSYVSPTIVFDQGDVWMTGWQTSTFDLSAFAGKTIRLVLRAGDIGDSIYDSAVLLDAIAVI